MALQARGRLALGSLQQQLLLGLVTAGKVDWDLVDEELERMPVEFKDARFDSLRHVLNILSAVDAEGAVEELRMQRERIEELVDDVVQGYHNGFNKAIHNYSQILQLFTNAKQHVDTLRVSLEDAKRRLGAQSRNLQQQWRRSVTLGDTVRLLADVRSVVDIPEKLQRLEEAKEWSAAVTLLLDGCNKLARHEMSRVGAVRDLKREMGTRRASLQKQMLHELEQRIYVANIKVYAHMKHGEEDSGDEEAAPTPSASPAAAMSE
eukprot:jgi/Astpho2/1519/Aster-x0067